MQTSRILTFLFLISLVFCSKIAPPSTYTAIVLGDIGQFDQYEPKVVKKAAQAIPANYLYKTDKCEEVPLTMNNFEKGVLTYIEKLEGDDAIILGDAVYTEAKGLAITFNTLTKPEDRVAVKQEFDRRLQCAWKYLENLFSNSKKEFLRKMTIIFGNHSMDVDYLGELKHMVRFLPWRTDIKALPNAAQAKEFEVDVLKPKISFGSGQHGRKVLYLDIDMSKLACSNTLHTLKDFKDCLKVTMTTAYPQQSSDDDQLRVWETHSYYYDELKMKLKKVARMPAKWKIVRLHQPIFNIERDYYGVKTNKELMGLFKKAGIHLWFVSHHHSAQVNIAKYEDGEYKYKVLNDGAAQRKEYSEAVMDLKDPNVDYKLSYDGLDDYFYDINGDGDKLTYKTKKNPIQVNRCSVLLNKCKKNVGTIYIKKHNPDYIVQLLAGNGGRKLDTLLSDLFTDSMLVYARALPQEFGYFVAKFTDTTATIEFKNGDKTNFTLRVVQNNKKAEDDKNFKVDVEEILNEKFTSDNIAK